MTNSILVHNVDLCQGSVHTVAHPAGCDVSVRGGDCVGLEVGETCMLKIVVRQLRESACISMTDLDSHWVMSMFSRGPTIILSRSL